MTMFYMAQSLAVTAGGIIMLYLLWDAQPTAGETLNATTFRRIIASMGLGGELVNKIVLAVVLAFEAGLLFVAANTGFLGGPSVLSNMAGDSWVPHQFRYLSTRLVTQNGILVMGVAALAILFWTRGQVTLLVVLYSISVFLTFAISLFGLCLYWWRHRKDARWVRRFLLSLTGFIICAGILAVLLVERFTQGGWATALIIAAIACLCIFIRNHYRETKRAIRSVDRVFANQPFGPVKEAVDPEPDAQTAVFIVGNSRGGGLHALLWVLRMFPGHFKNFLFVNARTVDAHAYGGEGALEKMRKDAARTLEYFVDFCQSHGMASASYIGFGTDAVEEVTRMCEQINREYPNSIFFTSKLIFASDNWFTRLLHNQASLAVQRRLHLEGLQMVILPMKV
jgi:hypothetical protein